MASINGSEAIVLNRMFTGDYLEDNIGHEVINLFKSDNGKFYLYLNALGSFHSDWKGRIKHYTLPYKGCKGIGYILSFLTKEITRLSANK